MKHIISLFIMLLLTAGGAWAQGSDHSGHGAPPGTPDHGGSHESMQTGGGMIMLDTVTTDGIKTMAHLQDLRQGATQSTAGATHNFMVGFEDAAKGTAITQGRAAVKVTGPDGKAGSAITLTLQDGFFRGDVELRKPGRYGFEVGTKLADEKVRQFRFTYELK